MNCGIKGWDENAIWRECSGGVSCQDHDVSSCEVKCDTGCCDYNGHYSDCSSHQKPCLYGPEFFKINYKKVNQQTSQQDNKQVSKQIQKEPMIRQITPEIAKIFTPEERILYRAGLMDETRRWSQEAQDLAMYLFLDGKKKEMVALAQELIQEQREDMMFSIGGFSSLAERTLKDKKQDAS